MTPQTPLTDEEIKVIEARCEAATKGPWVRQPRTVGASLREVDCEIVGNVGNGYNTPVCRLYTGFVTYEADKAFIAHARTDIPELLEEVRRLKAALVKAEGKVTG